MDISPYFDPVDFKTIGFDKESYDASLLISNVCFFHPEGELDLTGVEFAIIGVPESRNAFNNSSCSLAPDEIRSQFYQSAVCCRLFNNNALYILDPAAVIISTVC